LVNLRDDLHQTHCQLLRSQAVVSGMQSSKFWQLRNQWFKLKKRLGFKGRDDLFPV
jgi:hypothetical protein